MYAALEMDVDYILPGPFASVPENGHEFDSFPVEWAGGGHYSPASLRGTSQQGELNCKRDLIQVPKKKRAGWLSERRAEVVRKLNVDSSKPWKKDDCVGQALGGASGEVVLKMVRIIFMSHEESTIDMSLRHRIVRSTITCSSWRPSRHICWPGLMSHNQSASWTATSTFIPIWGMKMGVSNLLRMPT